MTDCLDMTVNYIFEHPLEALKQLSVIYWLLATLMCCTAAIGELCGTILHGRTAHVVASFVFLPLFMGLLVTIAWTFVRLTEGIEKANRKRVK